MSDQPANQAEHPDGDDTAGVGSASEQPAHERNSSSVERVNDAAPGEVEPVEDEGTGAELGEISGGGEVTDLGGDAPSS